MPIPIPVADALEEAALFVGEGGESMALDLLEQFVHTSLFRFAHLGFVLQLAGGAALGPALEPVQAAARRRGARRLVALQTRITLGKIVAKERLLAAGL